MKVTKIDPPMGWKFGFPRVLPEGVEISHAWFVEQGYPQEVIDAYGKHFYWRVWEEEVEDESLL